MRDGWLHTGDIVRIDDERNMFFYDRSKDVIKSGGMNVSSQEVERVLQQHEGVLRAAVVGVPDDYWSEKVTAFVIAKPGSQLEPDGARGVLPGPHGGVQGAEDRRGGRGVPHRPAGQGPQA